MRVEDYDIGGRAIRVIGGDAIMSVLDDTQEKPMREFTEEEAIKMLKSKMDGHTDTSYEWTETVRMAIKALEQNESAEEWYKLFVEKLEQESKWIPVSERLPEKDGRYLAYIVNEYDNQLQYIMTCDYMVDGHWHWFPDDECTSDNVIAWMPLPQPYKPQESEE